MADLRDDQGRPIQLTDELGRPVQLTDEHGVPIHLTGVATAAAAATTHHGGGTTTIGSELRDKTAHDYAATMGSKTHGGTHFAPTPVDYVKRGGEAVAAAVTGGGGAPASHTQAHGGGEQKKPLERASSSSSSSSEDDGQGGRRKKKGLKQKIKEKLPGHDGHGENETSKGAAHSIDTKSTSTTTGVGATAAGQQHQKKGFIDKIKDKLPGHHH